MPRAWSFQYGDVQRGACRRLVAVTRVSPGNLPDSPTSGAGCGLICTGRASSQGRSHLALVQHRPAASSQGRSHLALVQQGLQPEQPGPALE
eukprot:scaffold16479_cov127-Isochrysis_galbana.AAC.1